MCKKSGPGVPGTNLKASEGRNVAAGRNGQVPGATYIGDGASQGADAKMKGQEAKVELVYLQKSGAGVPGTDPKASEGWNVAAGRNGQVPGSTYIGD